MSKIFNRRHFIAGVAALMALTATPLVAEVEYTPGLVQSELAAGKTVFLDFSATWCSTCARQARVIDQLKSENSAYGDNVVFIKVDWDKYGRSDLAKAHKIPRRSTLIALKGDREIGRIIAGTAVADIKALMDAALASAT